MGMMTRNGNTTNLYLSGSDTIISTLTAAPQDTGTKIHIGKGQTGPGAGAYYLNGIVGEVQFYDGILTFTKFLANYNATKDQYTTDQNFNYVASGGVSVPDNSNNWTFAENDVMPYVEYIEVIKNGVQAGYWEWEYAATFTDQSVNTNTLTPTFRTASSNADVSAELVTFTPIAPATAPAYAVSDAPLFITENITVSSNFTEGAVGGAGPPGAAVIDEVATASGTANIWMWGILGGLAIALSGLFISYMERKHGGGTGTILLRIAIAVIIFGLLIAFDKYDFWMLVLYLFIALAPAIASRFGDFGGQPSELGLIGFLSLAWIGLTTINRIMEGQLTTAAETAHLNRLMFTQELTLLDLWKLPVMNFQFFTQGIPSLLKWDYSFFGGNAQLFQYMLYSINALVSFIILGFIIGLLTSNIIRAR